MALPAPACVKVKFATRILGAKKIKRGKRGVIKVRVKNTSSAASAKGATATFAVPRGFKVVKKPSGTKIRKGKVTLRFGTIGARKTKTVKLTLKANAKTKTGLTKRGVSIKAACGSKGSARMVVRIR